MASIEKRGDSTYRIIVSNGYDRNGKQIKERKIVELDASMTAKQQEKEIKRIAALFENEVKSGNCIDSSIKLEQFVQQWLVEHADKHLERKTISSYKCELESKILPALGHKRMNELKPLDLTRFYDNLTEDGVRLDGKPGGYSTRTIKYCHQIISSVLQSAVYWQVVSDNIAKRVKPPKGAPQEKKINFFDDEQTRRFLLYMHEQGIALKYVALAYITVFGGLRLEEVLPLTWTDIDFKNCTIDINKALSYVDGEQFVKDTKNDRSTRKIGLPPNVFTLLKEYRLQAPDIRLFDMHYTTPGHWLKKTIRRYNAQHKEPLPVISFHGLRHTNATLLISQRLDIRTVAGRLGHKDATTTLNIYSHYIQSRDEAASSALDDLLCK